MAGEVRQPVDIKALEKYIDQNIPQIKTPVELKQVRELVDCWRAFTDSDSLVSDSRTQRTRSPLQMDRNS